MVHLIHPTFPNGGYELQMKWEVNRSATFCFPYISSKVYKMLHLSGFTFRHGALFHPTFANGGSYMFNLNTGVPKNLGIPFHIQPAILGPPRGQYGF